MSKNTSADIRNAFIEYFKKNGHTHVASSSLIPENDATLLFANAGMNQFKNAFLGLEKRPYTRAVTSQKCVRAGGKHNDLENVGFTARHHTFFEMLGNFSFGDYFKKDAIHYAWEFLTKDLGIPKEKLYVTAHHTDDEAADLWHKQEGIPKDRIFRLGDDNFWRMGDTGPCGPCTEIFYDHGARGGKESDPYKGIVAGEDRYVEIWNLVFMQFFEKAPGDMEPLPKPSVDTGSGLERVVAAMQGKLNNYDTDLFMPMIDRACEVAKLSSLRGHLDELQKLGIYEFRNKYNNAGSVLSDIAALRVLADHSRSSAFLLADGALPSNEGRGYVLRRIMRRAIRYGKKLSDQSLMPQMMEVLIQQMSSVYPELKNRKDHILSTMKDEESRFTQTLDQGTSILNDELKKLRSQNAREVPGEILFKLYDTYGFPVDLTRVMAEEQGFVVDEKKFDTQMDTAREKAKSSWKGKAISTNEAHLIQLAQKAAATHFLGYETTMAKGKVIGLSNGNAEVASLSTGESGIVILDQTPFYAEGGGQVGDKGEIKTSSAKLEVIDCTKNNNAFLHHVRVVSGSLKNGETVETIVSHSDRRLTVANHSATHLMHAALRKVLGTHVTQAGSLVDPEKLRFDFTHTKPLSREEITQIENMVNEVVAKALPVTAEVMTPKAASAKGALALFGEKYGDQVRVLTMGDFSCELCGGTHVSNTSQIRLFKIVSESGVSSGVRRIEAYTSDGAFDYLNKLAQETLMARAVANLSPNDHLYQWIEIKNTELKNLEKQLKQMQAKKIDVDSLLSQAVYFETTDGKAGLLCADVDIEDRDVLSQLSDQLRDKMQNGIVVLVGKGAGSSPIIVTTSKTLTKSYPAGNILKEVATVMGGKGGGRPDFAQGAAPDRTQIKAAFDKARSLVQKQ